MQLFHKNNNKNSIIVFFSGWALDFSPYAHLFSNEYTNNYDILFVWDYRNTDFNFDFSKYEQIQAVSFSYGVFMSQFAPLQNLQTNIAINGTLRPISKDFGINPRMFDLTLNNLNETTLEKFYKNMFADQSEFETFIKSNNKKNIQDAYDELAKIKELAQNPPTPRAFTKALISNNDRIIPTTAQTSFWKDKTKNQTIECGHFPFYRYTLNELING